MICLIIDDSRAMRRVLQQIIEPLGFETVQADNGATGLQKLKETPGVVLTLVDWNMPEMNGLEFIKAARALPEFNSVKIVMVTTETEPVQIARAFMAGADEFVTKPFTGRIMHEKLKLIGAYLPQGT